MFFGFISFKNPCDLPLNIIISAAAISLNNHKMLGMYWNYFTQDRKYNEIGGIIS